MAHSLSAKKRNRQNIKRRIANRAKKAELKTMVRKLTDAIHDKKVEEATKQFSVVTKRSDQLVAKGIFHKNTVNRRKSRMAKRLNKLAAVAQ